MGNTQASLQPRQNWFRKAREATTRKSFYLTIKMLDTGLNAMERGREAMPSSARAFFEKMNDDAIREGEKRNENGLFEKSAGKIAKINQKILGRKRKLLCLLGVDEAGLIEKIGVERSFRVAKMGSHVDIFQECLNFCLGTATMFFGLTVTTYIMLKNGFPNIDFSTKELIESHAKKFIAETAPFVKFYFFAVLLPVGLVERGLTKIGNWMDFFQHVFLDSIVARVDGRVKGADEIYRKFAKESMRELIADVAIAYIPLPFIDMWRRIRAIKSEMRQLNHIEQMEKLYLQSKESAEKRE